MQGRGVRLIIGFFIPLLILPVKYSILYMIETGDIIMGVKVIPGMLFFTSFFTFVPALIYTFIMEYLINPKVHSDKTVIILSGLLGGLTGAQILSYKTLEKITIADFYWTAFGIVTGVIAGVILRRRYNRGRDKNTL